MRRQALPHRQVADKALRLTCARLGLEGSAATASAVPGSSGRRPGVPLHVVQKLTGHKSLGSLGEYLAVPNAEVLAAIVGLSSRVLPARPHPKKNT